MGGAHAGPRSAVGEKSRSRCRGRASSRRIQRRFARDRRRAHGQYLVADVTDRPREDGAPKPACTCDVRRSSQQRRRRSARREPDPSRDTPRQFRARFRSSATPQEQYRGTPRPEVPRSALAEPHLRDQDLRSPPRRCHTRSRPPGFSSRCESCGCDLRLIGSRS